MPEFCEAKSHLRATNNRVENAPAAIFRDSRIRLHFYYPVGVQYDQGVQPADAPGSSD